MAKPVQHIVIVGGGSAGWLTAGLLAAEYASNEPPLFRLTLIESPDVQTIGVGEGTWPTMRETLRRIGVSEHDFIRQCDASFKQASRFLQWRNGAADDSYYHPFMLPHGFTEAGLATAWQSLQNGISFAHCVTPQAAVCDKNLAPKQVATPEYAGVLNYGYHLNAGKFGEFLKQHCVEKLGVNYIADHVERVISKPNGDISHLQTRATGKLKGDLFIDCTGFKALLIGEHFAVPLVSQQAVLFNDRALAMQVPHQSAQSPIVSHTLSTAQSAGWIWDITLPTRRGIGYTFSSAHTDTDKAAAALKAYIRQDPHLNTAALADPREIKFQPGYRQTFWKNNCVAVGIAAGFIEPLEASALVMIEMAAGFIRDELPETREVMAIVSKRFNEKFRYRWQRIIDFLKLHYVLSARQDSTYWRQHRQPDSRSDRLQETADTVAIPPAQRVGL